MDPPVSAKTKGLFSEHEANGFIRVLGNGQPSVHSLLEPAAAFSVLIPPSLKHFLPLLPVSHPSPHLSGHILSLPQPVT